MRETALQTITLLLTKPHEVDERMQALATARRELGAAKEELVQLREDYNQALNAATMEAYAASALSGKNQAERDAQLAAWLHDAKPLAEAKWLKIAGENRVTRLELAVEIAENEVKALVYQLTSAQSAATLQAALLSYMDTLSAAQSAVTPPQGDAPRGSPAPRAVMPATTPSQRGISDDAIVRQAQRDQAWPAYMAQSSSDPLYR